jgi:hypothetical protein
LQSFPFLFLIGALVFRFSNKKKKPGCGCFGVHDQFRFLRVFSQWWVILVGGGDCRGLERKEKV